MVDVDTTSRTSQPAEEGKPSFAGLSNGVFEGITADGQRCYLLPPVPTGSGQTPIVVFDYLAHPEFIDQRESYNLPGGGRDAITCLNRNVSGNRELGPMTDWKELWGREKGKTCILACPGPSLTESLPEIALARKGEDVFVMGFNRTHRVLDVDYFVTIDRIGKPDWITRDVGETILIAATQAAPHITREFSKRYWGEEFLHGGDEGMTRLHSGLTLTVCDAMYAAYRLGATRIELYGCDCAISGHRAVDAKGKAYWHLDKYYVDQRSVTGTDDRRGSFGRQWPVFGIDGRTVFVNYEMIANAAYITASRMMLTHAGVEVVNKSKTGILFWGCHERG